MLLLGQRPLTTSDADSGLFANRSFELQRIRRARELGLNAYVHGPPGSGRTSLLRQVEREHPEARYIRLQGVENLAEWLEGVERAITRSEALPRERGNPIAEMFGQLATTQYKVVVDPLRHLKAALRQDQAASRHVVLVDDLGSDGCQELFGRLRDDLWELPIQWVVAGTSSHLEPPADTFFDVVVELQSFDLEGLQDLVDRRAASGTAAEGALLRSRVATAIESIAPCTPRHALSVIRDLYLSEDLADATSRLVEQRSARSRMSATASKVFDAFVHYGPTHAGDERLLAEVGVSRSRVVQVLAELESAGLVTSERVGRRKLYSTLTGADAARKPGEESTPDGLL